jgi:hypothetical protein
MTAALLAAGVACLSAGYALGCLAWRLTNRGGD